MVELITSLSSPLTFFLCLQVGSEHFWPTTGDFPQEMEKCARIIRAFTGSHFLRLSASAAAGDRQASEADFALSSLNSRGNGDHDQGRDDEEDEEGLEKDPTHDHSGGW